MIYESKGRRSKKREATFLADFQGYADEVAGELGGTIHWDKPLKDACYG